MPDNRPRDGVWHYVDVVAMAARARIAGAAPFYIVAGPAPNPGGYPIGAETRLTMRNDHLQYVLTWYALAAALVVIYLLYHRRRRIDGKAG